MQTSLVDTNPLWHHETPNLTPHEETESCNSLVAWHLDPTSRMICAQGRLKRVGFAGLVGKALNKAKAGVFLTIWQRCLWWMVRLRCYF